ncbi:NAD(P)-binding protein [Aspergillus ellipticus CBS 707.79]|uniref:NAD(P)-binding protein n=1 Tax=Aspergillus ellipticus CBS 707.79 TaxID=1448320 RepID=A0A319DI47_9EURO|nr:NAD(P)-binding protein [Aspergillus ellipticus CBS 707.79]
MPGTIIITGANGSLAIPAVQHLLTKYSEYTAVLTVRNTSELDPNTGRLHEAIAPFKSRTSVRRLNLSSLAEVKDFAQIVATEIASGTLPPLKSIICNAYYWNLAGEAETTDDDLDKTFQVNHISHAALVLRLLGSFRPSPGEDLGRIVLFGSDAHWPGKNGLEKYPPTIPEDLEVLVKPPPKNDDLAGRGFHQYALSKLAVIMWMYALNRHLSKNENLKGITAVAINPGNLSDSRALRTNTPWILRSMSRFIIRPLKPLLSLMDPTMRTSAEAGVDVAELAVGETYAGEEGFFTLLQKDDSSPESQDAEKQEKLWKKTLEWAQISPMDTAMAIE